MSLKPLTVIDTFSRNRTDTWGSADSGQSWQGTNANYDINGTVGTIQVPAGSARNTNFIQASSGVSQNVGLFRWQSSKASPLTDHGLMLNRVSANTFYAVSVQDYYDEVAILFYQNGTRYELNRTAFTAVKNQWYWMRFDRTSTQLRVKIWKRGTQEPSSWTLTSGLWDGSNPPSTGHGGYYVNGTTDTYTVETYAYYYYGSGNDDPGLPVDDTFERSVTTGWGISDTSHVWEGNFTLDPSILTRSEAGIVTDPGDGYAELQTNNDQDYYGFIGPNQSGNIETYAEESINSSAGQTNVYILARATDTTSAGVVSGTGYAVRITAGATTIPIMKKTTSGGAWTQVGTANTITALAANTVYAVRFQIIGTTLQARIWDKTLAEPGTWHSTGTDSSITSGRSGVLINQNTGVSTTRTIRIYRLQYQTPTVAGTNFTTTGTVTSTAITDTTLALRANFTNDSNANNTLPTVEYRVSGTPDWITFGGTKTRNAGFFAFTLTGLAKSTQYDVRCTFADADSVMGTNPISASFTTTNTGITSQTITVTAIGATTADIKATYLDDSDSDSTATLDYRTASLITTHVVDNFDDPYGTLLSAHEPDLGQVWLKHSTSAANTDMKIYTNRLGMTADALSGSSQTVRYYQNFTSIPNEYTVSALFVYKNIQGSTALTGRMSKTLITYYGIAYQASQTRWEFFKQVNGTYTLLETYTEVVNPDDIRQVSLILRDDYKSVEINGVEVIRSTDNTITSGVPGLAFTLPNTAISLPTETNHVLVDNYIVTSRTFGGSWTTSGAMTPDRVNKWFTRQATGLTADTIYEFRVTYTDADGTSKFNPLSTTAQTVGQAVGLSSLAASAQPNSIVLDIFYVYDTNNNSSISIQYRSVMDFLWTTVPQENILVNRGTKKFTAIISSLAANQTYQVQATVSDSNGIILGYPSTLTGLVTTSGPSIDATKRTKHYLWKVYDSEGNYLETWQDAGTPEFAWHENGGVSDLTVTLPRTLASLNDVHSSIQQQHRVDIWCLDPSSTGFGLNLIEDDEFTQGSWTLGSNASIASDEGPDGNSALKIVASAPQVVTRSSPILLTNPNSSIPDPVIVPFVLSALARSKGAKLTMFLEAYDINDVKLGQSAQLGETVGTDWQRIMLEYTPPATTYYLRACFQNDGSGTMWADKVTLRTKELLIYRGYIESFTPQVDQASESVDVEILGPVSLLSDDYVEFLQYVDVQPANDASAGRPKNDPADPADMMRDIINLAKAQNPRFSLYYTTESIRNTGTLLKYTFRDQQLRACFDKIRGLCPSGWHYYVEPDGLIVLRGPEHASTHTLRLGVEVMNFSVEKSIRNLKNYIHVKGRQDEDNSEPDGFGSINYITFDQESINKYGKRMLFIRDANITDPDTAELVGDGRLEEQNREEQRAQCTIPDDKSLYYVGRSLRGYNIESFRPGDSVIILDPIAGPRNTYWDQMIWDQDSWDNNLSPVFNLVSGAVPIKTVQFEDTQARLELSERAPSSVGDFGRLYRWLQLQDSDQNQ